MNITSVSIDYDSPTKSFLHEVLDEYGYWNMERSELLRMIDYGISCQRSQMRYYHMSITTATCDYDV